MSRRRACGLIGLSRSSLAYRSQAADDVKLREALLEYASKRKRYGYRRLHVLLRREGWTDNHKRVYRIYREEGLQVPKRKRKRAAKGRDAQCPAAPTRMNERWSMDFVQDALADGRKIRVLNVVDDFTRECLAVEAARQPRTGRRRYHEHEMSTKSGSVADCGFSCLFQPEKQGKGRNGSDSSTCV